MAKLSHDYRIESDEKLDENKILDVINNYIQAEFDSVTIEEKSFVCRDKTAIVNPIVTYNGNVEIQVKENKSKIKIFVDTKPNFWFWTEAVIFLTFFPLYIVLYFQWEHQKKSTKELLNNLQNKLDSEFGSF